MAKTLEELQAEYNTARHALAQAEHTFAAIRKLCLGDPASTAWFEATASYQAWQEAETAYSAAATAFFAARANAEWISQIRQVRI